VLELPGVDPASVEVVASGKTLVVGGTRERPTTSGGRYLAMEIDYGPFQRRIELGEEVDPAKASAAYDRGMLKVTLPLAVRAPSQGTVPIEVERRA
jgi:HSP20 family protein